MFDILQYIPPKSKKSPAGWFVFNCPACIHNGETPDKRRRGGLIVEGQSWSYACFNCNYKAKFVFGNQLTLKAKNLLKWMGVDEETIQRINLESLKNKAIYDVATERTNEIVQRNIFFKRHRFPASVRPVTIYDKWAIEYLMSRGIDYRDYDFKINSADGVIKRIIVPYHYGTDIVGWTSRYLNNEKSKYVNEHQQPGFVFGLDMQKNEWDYLIASEGIFDAISIKGVSLLHNEISEKQAALLRRQGKEVIVVPDQDKAGLVLAEQAIDNGFSISIPQWDNNIKDINDAVLRYGKIGTLLSILNNKTNNKIKAKVAINNLIARKYL